MTLSLEKKICVLTSVHPAFDIRIFHKEVKTLYNAGYDIFLIAQHDKEEAVDGINILPIPKPSNRFERMTKTVWTIYWRALKIDADIYHIHDPELLPIARLLALRGKRVIYDMHENVPKQIMNKDWINPSLRNYLAKLVSLVEKILLVDIPIIFAETSYHRDYSWANNYITILNMPLANQLRSLKKEFRKADKSSIGYIGSVSEARGSLITIEALRILNSRGVKISFECIGPVDKTHEKQILKLCEQYNLNNINFYGRMQAFEGWSIIAKCCIGMAVLQPVPNYIGSYPTKMFEYMALGLPVITSDFPLWREIVESAACGLLVNPMDPVEIADAVAYLIENPEEAKEMGQNGLRAVNEKYNWDMEKEKLLKFYGKILQVA